jgi:uncharacterized protein (DUF927 family)
LRESEKTIDGIVYLHEKLGWKKGDFFHSGKSEETYFLNKDLDDMSEYAGIFDVAPKGTLKAWTLFFNKVVAENTALAFIVCASVSSIVLGFLKSQVVTDNYIVHLSSESSYGKTTALTLAISIFGNPVIGTNSLCSTWNTTANALIKRMMGSTGVTFGLDEISMFQGKNLSDVVYKISSGSDKDRLCRDASLKEKESGTFVVISTGESSLLGKCNGNNGLSMRVLEFERDAWTSSAEQAELVSKFAKKHYGTIAPMVALWLKNIPNKRKLLKEYEKMRCYYIENTKQTGRKERLSSIIAFILLAARILKKCGLDVNYQEICNFIVENEIQTLDKKNNFDGCYEKFKNFVNSHEREFVERYDEVGRDCASHSYGKFKAEEVYEYNESVQIPEELDEDFVDETEEKKWFRFPRKIAIRPYYFQQFARSEGYEDAKQLIKFFKKKGLLSCDKDRLTRKIVIGCSGVKEEVYVILLLNNEENAKKAVELMNQIKSTCKRKRNQNKRKNRG